jgi:hypothetical protein
MKPLGSLVLHRVYQSVVKVLLLFLETKLDPGTTQDVGFGGARVGFQFEEVVEESDGRWNSKESFAKMNKYRKMEDGVGIQMV